MAERAKCEKTSYNSAASSDWLVCKGGYINQSRLCIASDGPPFANFFRESCSSHSLLPAFRRRCPHSLVRQVIEPFEN